MQVSDEIRAAQEAYNARPFAVRWVDSHAALTNRFYTFEAAFAYVQEQWARIQETVRTNKYRESQLSKCYLETPEGRTSLRYWLLCDDVSSYY